MDISSFLIGLQAGKKSAGGGGLLPAGAYWKPLGMKFPNRYGQSWHTYQGNVYAVTSSSASVYAGQIYRLDGDTWTLVTSTSTYWSIGRGSAVNSIEFNGKLHIYGGASKNHFVFDGTTMIAKNSFPTNVYSGGSLFVENGTLKMSGDSYKVYAWDEATDTWTQEGSVGGYYCLFNIDGVVYGFKSSSCLIYENGTVTNMGDTLSVSSNRMFRCGNNVYCSKEVRDSPTVLYKFDFDVLDWVSIAELPCHYSNASSIWVHNDKIRWLGVADGNNGAFPGIMELCIVEG